MSKPETIMIDDVKYIRADAVEGIKLPDGDFAPYEIGESYHVETVTKYFTGVLVMVTEQELVLTKCSWIPLTGRHHKYAGGSQPEECEPFPVTKLVIIGRGALIDCYKREIFIEVK